MLAAIAGSFLDGRLKSQRTHVAQNSALQAANAMRALWNIDHFTT
jgi:hypothetical protein